MSGIVNDAKGCLEMDANDRQLISNMFERMQNVQGLQVDTDAEAFIHDCMRQNPNSPYLLVQSVLVQEQALQQADTRIKELEKKVAEQAAQAEKSAQNKGSFTAPRTSAGFGGRPGAASSVPQTGAAPWQSAPPTPHQRAENRQAGGGGFMAQAMTTAAGVAGGMLLASGISSLMSGGSSSAEAATPTADEAAATDTPADNATEQQAADTSQPEPAQEDTAVQDASTDDGGFFGDWGGGDSFGGDDFEI